MEPVPDAFESALLAGFIFYLQQKWNEGLSEPKCVCSVVTQPIATLSIQTCWVTAVMGVHLPVLTGYAPDTWIFRAGKTRYFSGKG